MRKWRTRLVFSLGLLLAGCGFSLALDPSLDVSQYAHSSWKIGEGIANDTTHTIVQTPDGYLWLATESGVCRFDGVRSVLWQPPAGERLPGREIRDLHVSRDGTLWIGVDKGLASWKDGKFTHYPQLDGYDVPALGEDHEGNVWAAGVRWEHAFWEPGKVCEIRSGNIQCIGTDGVFGFGVTQFHEDRHGNFWLGAANGVWRWNPAPPERYPFPAGILGSPTLIFSRNSIIDGERGLIIAGYRDIFEFVNGKLKPFPFPIPPPPLKNASLLRDRDGNLWISGSDVGLVHVHQGRMDFFTDHDGLSSNSVEGMFEDREGSIWITTNKGIDRFRENTIPTVSIGQGLSSRAVFCVLAARDGGVWLGTSDGLNRWNDGRVTIYRTATVRAPQSSETSIRGRAREVISKDLPENFIISLLEDRKGRIWVSTPRGLAYVENETFHRVRGLPFAPQNPLVEDTAGNLWTAQGDRGLIRLREGKLAESIPWTALGIAGALANPLAADRLKGVWVGSWGGGVIHFQDGQVRASYGTKNGLGEGRVNSLQFDGSGRLWAATDGGLSLIRNGHAITLTSKNGLPCDSAHDVLEDNAHTFWIRTACGLVRIANADLEAWVADPAQKVKVTVYDASAGVLSHAGVYNFGPRATKTADGKLWFTPIEGVMVVDPNHLPSNPVAPPVEIEEIKGDGNIVWRNLSRGSAGKVLVPRLTRRLEITYTGLSFVAPEKVRFKYKLEGYDREWQDAGSRRQAIYTNLPPRTYSFRVIASNNSGVWNETGDTLVFTLPPAWYQTLWFWALCGVAFFLFLLGIYYRRMQQLQHEFALTLEARVGERTRIARDLHDTLLQSFHGLLLRFQAAFLLLPERPTEAKEKLGSAIEQAASAITEGRDAVQGLRASTSDHNDLAIAIGTLGQELENDGSNHPPASFRVSVEGQPRELHPILRDEIYKIAAEALRNAFHHSQAKQIEVELRYDDDQFRLRVRDDGKGIDPALLAGDGVEGHYGLNGMRERANLIKGKLTVWSEVVSGTEVDLRVPASAAYTADRKRSWVLWKSAGVGKNIET